MGPGRHVRIGTRGSALALRQAELVAGALRRHWPGLGVELVPIKTSGDRFAQVTLAEVGGKGLFVKEIEEALLDGRVELAVHSLKDLPGLPTEGLVLAAFPEREDPRDVLITREGGRLDTLRSGARVGTGSPRRKVQLLARRPDLKVEPIRGNLDTRLRKLQETPYDAIVVARAGLARLGLAPEHTSVLSPEEMLPAVGQGALAVQTRAGDAPTRELLAPLDHPPTRIAVLAERALLARLGGNCYVALAALARLEGDRLRLDALLASPDGVRILREPLTGPPEAPEALGTALAERLLAAGGAEILLATETARGGFR